MASISSSMPLPAAATAALEVGPTSFKQMPSTKGISSKADAERVGREFEAMFLSQMLQPVFDALPTDKFFGGGNGEKMMRSLQVDEYAKGMSKAGGIGLGAAITREILRMQEKAHAPAPG
jgi:flagellar protein FlgJ